MKNMEGIIDFETAVMEKERKAPDAQIESLTAEDLAEMCFAVENFRGTWQDAEALARYQRFSRAVQRMHAGGESVAACGTNPPHPSKRHAGVWADVSAITYLAKQQFCAFSEAVQLSDAMFLVCGQSAGKIHITFNVCDVWQA